MKIIPTILIFFLLFTLTSCRLTGPITFGFGFETKEGQELKGSVTFHGRGKQPVEAQK